MSLLQLKPLRDPHANQISTTVFFFSPKMNRQVWCESNLEWDTAILLDQDPSILEFWEQSIELQWSKSTWTPDFVALVQSEGKYKILILEVKYIQELLENRDHYRQKFAETDAWIQQNLQQLIAQITNLPITQIEFLVVTDLNLQQTFRVRNYRKLIQAVIENQFDLAISEKVHNIMDHVSQITFQALVDTVNALGKHRLSKIETIYTTIYAMLYRQELQTDYDALLTPDSILYNSAQKFMTLETWLKRCDWQDQDQLYTPLIHHEDLFFIAKTPEKSIEFWNIAFKRYELICPLLELSIKQLKATQISFQGKHLHWMTLYDWIKRLKHAKGDIRALLPQYEKSGRKKADSDLIWMELWEYGKQQYLQRERKSIQQAYNLMESYAHLHQQEQHCMSYMSFYRRIQALNGIEVAKRRLGDRNAEKEYELSESEFPHADYPLQSVQIDHTPLDVMVVDEENRLVTTRPFLTVAFDCHTRCVLGYHLTYNDPSRLSIAMTLINCVQKKDGSLDKITTLFPALDQTIIDMIRTSDWKEVYGLPYTLHMDNATEFRSDDLRLFGIRYKIHLHYRAVKKPQHGAYIERFLGTLNTRLHALAGTTFSNTAERKDYPSEKRAIFTINELEAHVLIELLQYHTQYHSQIRMAPLKKWQDAFARNGQESAISHNLTQMDLTCFHLDVLPSEMRTVQKSGVQLFGLSYSDPRIQQWIGAKNPEAISEKRNFLIRYDPRDIRTVYFYSSDDHVYIPLKCHDHFVNTYYANQELALWQWDTIKRNQQEEYRRPCLDYAGKKRAYLQAQQEMDQEVAVRSKRARIKRAKHQSNAEQHRAFMENAGITHEKSQRSPQVTASMFQNIKAEAIEIITIPPDEENPFYGIEWDVKTGEIKKKGK